MVVGVFFEGGEPQRELDMELFGLLWRRLGMKFCSGLDKGGRSPFGCLRTGALSNGSATPWKWKEWIVWHRGKRQHFLGFPGAVIVVA